MIAMWVAWMSPRSGLRMWITQDFGAIFAMHCGFAISSQFNLIVAIAFGIGMDFGLILPRFRLGGLQSDCNSGAILRRLLAFGRNPRSNLSKLCQDCIRYAIDPQSTGLHITFSRFCGRIAGHREDCRGPLGTPLVRAPA